MENIAKDLEEVLTLARNILRAEVLSEPLEEFTLLGLSEQDIRRFLITPRKPWVYLTLCHPMTWGNNGTSQYGENPGKGNGACCC